ncbi:MAG: type III secretion system cytoplasmic ring protein SctQ [Myxococcota bacterium]
MDASREATTLVSTVKRAPAKAQAPFANRVQLRPVRKITRAHLSLAQRPQAVEEAHAALAAVATHLSQQLGVEVKLTAHLADATLHPFSHLAREAVFALFELQGEAVGVLEVDRIAAGALLQHIAGTQPTQVAPLTLTRIEEAAFGWLLLSVLSTLRGQQAVASHCTPRLISFHTDRGPVLTTLDARRRHVGIEISLSVGELNGHARLLVPSQWIQSRMERIPAAPPTELAPEVGAAELIASCCVGKMELERADAEALVPGDVVVFKALQKDGEALFGPARLTTPAFELFGDFHADGFTLTRASERSTLESHMSTPDPTLPVDVEIELARLRLPLQQLAALRPGGVLPLHVNAAQTVIIRIGDKPVAKAELVEIEGEIGARILSLL